ncbi:MAG: rod shape-determining protein, partial [Candidatus Omnitrophota bacterium]
LVRFFKCPATSSALAAPSATTMIKLDFPRCWPLRAILDIAKISLERTPPELAADLIEHGIVMAGGGSLLRGIDKLISEETGLPVLIADDPLTAVANGTGKVLSEIRYLKKVTVPIKYEMHS